MSVTTGVIQNPDAEPITVRSNYDISNEEFIVKYGSEVKKGALIALFNFDTGLLVNSRQFIADRIQNRVYLQNNVLADKDSCSIDAVGEIVEDGLAPLENDTPALETYTVFGFNDNDERFTAVISSTDEAVYDDAVIAGLVDPGYEYLVRVAAIFRGDYSDLEQVDL